MVGHIPLEDGILVRVQVPQLPYKIKEKNYGNLGKQEKDSKEA